jgi:hypothetical protein
LNAYVIEFREFTHSTACTILITKRDLSADPNLIPVVPGQIGSVIAIVNDKIWALKEVKRRGDDTVVPLIIGESFFSYSF